MYTTTQQLRDLQHRSSSTTSHAFATGTWNNIKHHWGSYNIDLHLQLLMPLPLVRGTISNIIGVVITSFVIISTSPLPLDIFSYESPTIVQ